MIANANWEICCVAMTDQKLSESISIGQGNNKWSYGIHNNCN